MKQQAFTVSKRQKYIFTRPEQSEFEEDLLKMWISAGWSFNSIMDPAVRGFYQKHLPGAKLPNRDTLSNRILTHVTELTQAKIKEENQGAFATMQADGLKDITKKHVVAFLYSVAGDVLLTFLSLLRALTYLIPVSSHQIPRYDR
jgi:hypothetical protein